MLKRLSIQNYAIIDAIEIDFDAHFNGITGETGAGKSILMGALSLILGDRADTSVLLNSQKKCIVEGFFDVIGKKSIQKFLKEEDLDAENELVIRREINSGGKSRAFINDTPVTLEQLRNLSSMLVDLHRQFDTLDLGASDFQREVLDALASNDAVLEQYQNLFAEWQEAKKTFAALQLQKEQFTKEYDYNKFLFDELEEANFSDSELELANEEFKIQANTEEIKEAISKVVFGLGEGETPITQQLKQFANQLQHYSSLMPSLASLQERLQSAYIELKDVYNELEAVGDQVQFDPKRMNHLQERMAIGYKLQKKHGLNTTNELLELKEQLSNKLQAVLEIDDQIAAAAKTVANVESKLEELAASLSAKRQKQIKPLCDQVNTLLAQVGMPNARLKVNVEPSQQLHYFGKDEIAFLFDANKSNKFEPIRKVASGGELSRLMLCIKSLVAKSLQLATLIFDEIDTGISGEAARQVGIILKGLAEKIQIICITHQPQIAGKANAHYFVYKEIKGDAIKTNIRQLTTDERITAIAKMLSGEKPTAAALENAREMVGN